MRLLVPALLLCQLFACLADEEGEGAAGTENTVHIRMASEPRGLNPLLSTRGDSRYVEDQIFQTLNEIDPRTFKLVPSLASVPVRERLDDDQFSYNYVIDSAARWPNGMPVTAHDVLFSLKALLNPLVDAGAYRPYYRMVSDFRIDATDDRRFSVYTDRPYLLTERSLGDLYVYPEYAYDPEQLLRGVPLEQLVEAERAEQAAANGVALQQFAETFADPSLSYEPERVVGSGPYRLVKWADGRQLRLERRADYWGGNRDELWLASRPDALVYQIILDDATVAGALRNGAVDVVLDLPNDQFRRLRGEEEVSDDYNFEVVPGFDYYAILFNQDHPLLRDAETRRALAHLVDVDLIIGRLLGGLGERVTGPVLPSKPYYNDSLPAIEYDPARARNLLSTAGWKDEDDDGVLEKTIDGERRDFAFSLLSFSSGMSEAIALELAENARQVGIDIRVNRQESRTLYSRLQSGDFAASMIGQRYLPGPDDLTQVWSSTSVPPAGSNRGNFRVPEADSLIRRLSVTLDEKKRLPLYRRFQELVYANQPMIFLFSPYDRVVVSDRFDYEVTSLAPNVYFNALELRTDVGERRPSR